MTDDPERFVDIPLERLSEEAVRRLVEEFVSRDGTDYGRTEKSLDQKVADVMRQLRRGDVKVVFDTETQSANLVVAERPTMTGDG